ncbi:MAG: hypothetical protein K2X41_12180 [Hyphomicrobium sp.]|nr:hypothetical protein [Hyphomicrobium sp.]
MASGKLHKLASVGRLPGLRLSVRWTRAVAYLIVIMLSLAPIATIIDVAQAASLSMPMAAASQTEAMPCHGAAAMIVVSHDQSSSSKAQRPAGRPAERISGGKPSCMCTPWCASALLAAVIAVEEEAFVVSSHATHPTTSIKSAPSEQPFEPPRC